MPSKSGSSSGIAAYLALAGFDVTGQALRPHRIAFDGVDAEGAGLRMVHVASGDLDGFFARHEGWHRFCTIRNPYDRAVSNWHNKLNRFAKRSHRPAYLFGKLAQLLGGPKAWPHTEYANRSMQRWIGLNRMLRGLAKGGVGFDGHFEEQVRLLGLDRFRYDAVIRLETFGADFRAALDRAGAGPDMLERLATVPRLNRTADEWKAAPLTAETVALIARAYPYDCALLGYAAPAGAGGRTA